MAQSSFLRNIPSAAFNFTPPLHGLTYASTREPSAKTFPYPDHHAATEVERTGFFYAREANLVWEDGDAGRFPVVEVIFVMFGAVLVLVTLLDVIWTTLASSGGAGPITRHFAPFLWSGIVRVHRRRPSHAFLSGSAVALVVLVLALWIALMTVGWWLITLGGSDPIVTSSTGATADALDRLYFTGYTLFTLGNGDFRPSGSVWQMATVAMAGSGLILITLSITYLVPIATTAAAQRQLSTFIFSLGDTPQELLTQAWCGGNFRVLETHLTGLAPELHAAGQSYLTYPVLHYLHPTDPRSAAPNAFVHLALALELMDTAVHPSIRPAPLATEPCRQGLQLFLRTLRGAHIEAADVPLDLPDLDPLTEMGIPLVSEGEYRAEGHRSEHTRRLLAGLLTHTGWSEHPTGREQDPWESPAS